MRESLIKDNIKEEIKKEFEKWLSIRKVRDKINKRLNLNLTFHNVRNCLNIEPIKSDLHSIIAEDRKENKEKRNDINVNKKYKELLIRFDDLENQLDIITDAKNHKPNYTEIKESTNISEATAVVLASDWHIEEIVDPAVVNYLNEYNPSIAETRARNFFKNSLRLTDIMAKDVKLENIIIALLWDFISWYIHPELVENNSMSPTQALIKFQDIMVSWINYILDNSKYKLTLICKFWNHWRSTDKYMVSTWYKNSYEWLIYHILADRFKNNERVNFIIENWYHTYFKIYDYTLRFHHWEGIRFGWWVWGLTIPLNKAISQWNKAKKADLDCLWHWHQTLNTKDACVNWSLIWYWPYSINIKSEFEKPQQTFFLIDKNYGRTITAPILLDK